ncbi:hypothetical protein [Sulfurovum riftiae]|nr:hypothetical protein [Sulfurovum riftiae]
MKQKKLQKAFAKILIVTTLLLWIFERMTSVLSDALGKWLYGEKYMQPVDGYVGDRSYGFNTDMHLSLLLIVLFILGMVLYISSKKDTVSEKQTN